MPIKQLESLVCHCYCHFCHVYSVPGHMINYNSLIYDIYFAHISPFMCVKQFAHVALMCNFLDTFASDIYNAITCGVDVKLIVVWSICSNHCFMSSYNIRAK